MDCLEALAIILRKMVELDENSQQVDYRPFPEERSADWWNVLRRAANSDVGIELLSFLGVPRISSPDPFFEELKDRFKGFGRDFVKMVMWEQICQERQNQE